ncbi:MAG: hypothetical protein Q7S27_01820 [Nanoarchaeota archaeon]|nr:hypothetical protein [Nanoarchaeota archaeon]
MGKNRDIESLIRVIVNTVTHQIVIKHTNRPESTNFLNSEIIEYRGQAEKIASSYNWNNEDKKFVEERALKKIIEKLTAKYSDIDYTKDEAVTKLKEIIDELM